ncbi:hypothetical protein LINPERPRIM_LOCUS14511, partial [Linum perenne]
NTLILQLIPRLCGWYFKCWSKLYFWIFDLFTVPVHFIVFTFHKIGVLHFGIRAGFLLFLGLPRNTGRSIWYKNYFGNFKGKRVLSSEGFKPRFKVEKGFSRAPVSDPCIMASAQKLPR